MKNIKYFVGYTDDNNSRVVQFPDKDKAQTFYNLVEKRSGVIHIFMKTEILNKETFKWVEPEELDVDDTEKYRPEYKDK